MLRLAGAIYTLGVVARLALQERIDAVRARPERGDQIVGWVIAAASAAILAVLAYNTLRPIVEGWLERANIGFD